MSGVQLLLQCTTPTTQWFSAPLFYFFFLILSVASRSHYRPFCDRFDSIRSDPSMEGENCKRVPSVPTNFLTLAQLQERWLREKQKEKEEEEKEARRQKEEEEEEERNRKEKEEQQQKIRIHQSLKRQNEYGVRPRSNNVPRPPFHRNRPNQFAGEQKPAKTHVAEVFSVETDGYVKRRSGWKRGEPINRNRQNQCPNGGASDGKLEPEETHIGESVAGVGELKIDGSLKSRTGSERGKPFHRSLQNQSPVGGGSGNTELKLVKTHFAEVTPEDEGRKIDDSIKKTGSEERRGNPRSEKVDRTGVLLPKRGAGEEITASGKDRSGEKKAWVGELETKIEKISLCGDGGGEVLNVRHSGYVHGGGHHHRKCNKVPGGIDWRKRNSNLVWVKKEG